MDNYFDKLPKDIQDLLTALENSETPKQRIWTRLWDELHHQGDVYVQSYFCVPLIFNIYKEKAWLDANLPAFLSEIENCRNNPANPLLPKYLEKDYFEALNTAVKFIADKIELDWDRALLIYSLKLISAIKKNDAIFEILDIVSASEVDEKYLLNLYYESE